MDEGIAAQTDGFGAAMAAIVRAAVARALDRSVRSEDVQGCRVTSDDFERRCRTRSSSLEPAGYTGGGGAGGGAQMAPAALRIVLWSASVMSYVNSRFQ